MGFWSSLANVFRHRVYKTVSGSIIEIAEVLKKADEALADDSKIDLVEAIEIIRELKDVVAAMMGKEL